MFKLVYKIDFWETETKVSNGNFHTFFQGTFLLSCAPVS